jgi:predicted transglutaminase-like cysteine proteinase
LVGGLAVVVLLLALLTAPRMLAVEMPDAEPFGVTAKAAPDSAIAAKWRPVAIQIDKELEVLRGCRTGPTCPLAAARFLALVDAARNLSGRNRIEQVNRTVNAAIALRSDWQQWQRPDRWAAPLETFTAGAGDCEDIAIAKYVALGEAGVAADDLRIVVIQIESRPRRDYHVVTAIRDGAHWLLLDMLRQDVVADTAAFDYTPRFMIDHRGVREVPGSAAPLSSRTCGRKSVG